MSLEKTLKYKIFQVFFKGTFGFSDFLVDFDKKKTNKISTLQSGIELEIPNFQLRDAKRALNHRAKFPDTLKQEKS